MKAKLKLTTEQKEQVFALRLEGLALRAMAEQAREAYEAAKEREKAVEQAAIMAEVFTYAEDSFDKKEGERITDGREAFEMGGAIFREKFLPIVKQKWLELYGLDYPLNYTPTHSEYLRPYLEALKNYRLIAPRFLRICGQNEEADEIEKAIKEYLPPKIAERIDALNDNFTGGRD